jgi:hypothetical protein
MLQQEIGDYQYKNYHHLLVHKRTVNREKKEERNVLNGRASEDECRTQIHWIRDD